jgi:nicotinate-nucleotide adenylyltransferase
VFDPLHSGHIAVARAALRKFRLDAIFFIPSGRPPHKAQGPITPFEHRYAMVVLACAGEPRFIPSLAEADTSGAGAFSYTIDTVRRFQSQLAGKASRLFFITGADAFLQIATWKEPLALLDSCDFIVAHRPGFSVNRLADAIPAELRSQAAPSARRGRASKAAAAIPLRRTTVHVLETVSSEVSSTGIRQRRKHGRSISGLVPRLVEEYIEKQALYRA